MRSRTYPPYRPIGWEWPGGHEAVQHSINEFIRGGAQTDTAESFFSLLKCGAYGRFHAVSKRHLHRYVSELQFRWNTRDMRDEDRGEKAVRNSQGNRLMYYEPKAADLRRQAGQD